MISLDAISVFAEVARLKSFTEAARVLNVPLSTVSRKVSELETSLRVQLVDRSKRQIRLTEAGATYYDLCRKGLETLVHANRVMTDRHTDTIGTVTITVPPNLFEILFLETIETFQARHPKAKLRVFVTERILDFVEDGVDLSFRVAPPNQPDLVTRTLLRYRHRLVAAARYAAVNSLPRTPGELQHHNCIGFGFSKKRHLSWSLTKQRDIENVSFEPHLSVNDYAAIRSAILSGHGIGELPEPLCTDLIQSGQLIEVLPDWRFPEIRLFAVHAGKAGMPKLARLFLDIAAKQVGA
ncbi:HTH-type transcriptional regulator DmlR [Pseudovibrio axinellae]|uniref:HTH-type transcriptional regulator DmlR n=1 Tax=Pseudovibrio axinellae TaxID=989403 RepID=A0A165TWX6_9HYPH|nr:LysR family transcriptional regulator [Pseudovibrio axinellae]KZL06745.1 HTH-type transcriptional regulator DmlR [Pseudovibrio axinellae]SER62711.1 DNA-binding transcriptional regulator, LysR family [Pseudovibrio axinellae]